MGDGRGVGTGVSVGGGFDVAVGVGIGVKVGVGFLVAVRVGVGRRVGVAEGCKVAMRMAVAAGCGVAVEMTVRTSGARGTAVGLISTSPEHAIAAAATKAASCSVTQFFNMRL